MSADAETKVTVEEMIESLTGFEEIAIKKAFDSDIFNLLNTAPTTAGRALVFIDKKRSGLSDKDAKNEALEMRLKDVDDYFEDEEPEVDEEDPVTPSGND